MMYLSDDEVLFNLLELNIKRALEEEQGKIRWLRPEYQKELYEASISLFEYNKKCVNTEVVKSKLVALTFFDFIDKELDTNEELEQRSLPQNDRPIKQGSILLA